MVQQACDRRQLPSRDRAHPYAGQPYSLIDVGIGTIAILTVFGWLFGFGLSGDLFKAARFARRGLRRAPSV